MMRTIWALPGLVAEPSLVAEAPAAGITIVRRCVDAADLLACAAAEPTAPVVLGASVPRLDAEIVRRVQAGARTVIGAAADAAEVDRLHAWGVPAVPLPSQPAQAMAALAYALRMPGTPVMPAPGVFTPPEQATSFSPSSSPSVESHPQASRGRVIAIWGPSGSPGRTSTAIAVADELAARGLRTCLIDADLRSPAIAVALGIAEPSGGILAAARQADSGLTDAVLPARTVRGNLAVLTGLAHPSRWPDIRPAALSLAIARCARSFDAVVVDPGPAPLTATGTGPTGDHDPDACAAACLEAADVVIAVARDDVMGIARLTWAWPSIARVPVALGLVRVPGASRGGRRALADAGVAVPVESIPWERAWSRALAAGATLAETAPRSSARRAYRALAALAA